MNIIMNGDGAWPDLPPDVGRSDNIAAMAVLDAGMASGAPSVAFRIELDDGTTVIAQTSAKLLVTAARAVMAKYPGLLD